jgi:hypothetical protein
MKHSPVKARSGRLNNNQQGFISMMILMTATLIIILGMILLAEKILAKKDKTHYGIRRFIRLKELSPLRNGFIIPSDQDMRVADGLVKKKYRIQIDKDGFIMPSRKYNDPDLSIIFLGGSTTKCAYVAEKNRFPYLVGELLEKKTAKRINSYNSGVGGNHSLHSIDILINKVLPINPDIVVLMHNINDLNTLLYEGSYWNTNSSRSLIITDNIPSLFSRLIQDVGIAVIPNISVRLGRLIYNLKIFTDDEFKQIRGEKRSIDEDKLVFAFRKNLQTFISICKIHRTIPVLMTQANRISIKPDPIIKKAITENLGKFGISNAYENYKEVYDKFNQTIRDAAKENEVLLVDLAAKIPQKREYIYDTAHLNDAGSKIAAQIISESLYPIILQYHSLKNKS